MKVQYVSVGILINDKSEVLMEQRETSPNYDGLLQFPGGKIEEGESPKEALLREIEEELGVVLDLEATEPLNFVEYSTEAKVNYAVLFYICKSWYGEVQPMISQRLTWIPLQDLSSLPHLPYNLEIIKLLGSRI